MGPQNQVTHISKNNNANQHQQTESNTLIQNETPTSKNKNGKNLKDVDVLLMKDSDLTEDQRRKLRTKQRELYNAINSVEGDQISKVESGACQKFSKQNNLLFNDARYTRECVLDGMNLEAIAQRASHQADPLVQVTTRFDVSRVIMKLKQKAPLNGSSNNGVNWNLFGRSIAKLFQAVPRTEFMLGPVTNEFLNEKTPVRKRKRNNNDDSDIEEEKPDYQKRKERSAKSLSATTKHFKSVHNTIKHPYDEHITSQTQVVVEETQRSLSSSTPSPITPKIIKQQVKSILKPAEVSMVHTLFHPNSFTQTVENLYHLSHLVKEKKVGVRVDERSKIPVVSYKPSKHVLEKSLSKSGLDPPFVNEVLKRYDREHSKEPQATQTIISLSKSDYLKLVKSYVVKECAVPDRTQAYHGNARDDEGKDEEEE